MASSKAAGVKDETRKLKPVKAKVKNAKYGWHGGKDLTHTKTMPC